MIAQIVVDTEGDVWDREKKDTAARVVKEQQDFLRSWRKMHFRSAATESPIRVPAF